MYVLKYVSTPTRPMWGYASDSELPLKCSQNTFCVPQQLDIKKTHAKNTSVTLTRTCRHTHILAACHEKITVQWNIHCILTCMRVIWEFAFCRLCTDST